MHRRLTEMMTSMTISKMNIFRKTNEMSDFAEQS